MIPTDPASRFSGLAPYWRAAYEEDWDKYSVMFGTFGMFANIAPVGNQSAPTNESLMWVVTRNFSTLAKSTR